MFEMGVLPPSFVNFHRFGIRFRQSYILRLILNSTFRKLYYYFKMMIRYKIRIVCYKTKALFTYIRFDIKRLK